LSQKVRVTAVRLLRLSNRLRKARPDEKGPPDREYEKSSEATGALHCHFSRNKLCTK